jgi:UDP-N-acetylmuramoylalanine--D-glutamate ligase
LPLKKICWEGVAILGFGRSGRAVADFLLPRGICPTVYVPSVPDDVAEYVARGLKFCVGEFPSHFRQRLLVCSPGIRPDLPSLVRSLAAGAQLTSEAELFLSLTKATVIGVTGSDGKTTTAALTAALLRGAGKCVFLGGNNGVPLLPHVDEMTEDDVAVLELSSFQLMTVTRSPEIAVITNITPNHLNWHTDMAEYVAAKRRIFTQGAKRLVQSGHLADIGGDLPTTRFSATEREILLTDDSGTCRYPIPAEFRLPGQYNRENLAAAYAAVRDHVPYDTVPAALAGFDGVPHRLQYVDTVADVRYYNSSIDTTPSRAAVTLTAFGERPVVLAGGRGKSLSFFPLREVLSRNARVLVVYGEAGQEMCRALEGALPIHAFDDFASAFHACARMARAGEAVVLSPACTAFDQFRDFEARGHTFCALVREMKA